MTLIYYLVMFCFTLFSGSMLIGQKLSLGVEFSNFIVCLLIGASILGYIGAKTGKNMKELSHMSFGKKVCIFHYCLWK